MKNEFNKKEDVVYTKVCENCGCKIEISSYLTDAQITAIRFCSQDCAYTNQKYENDIFGGPIK